MPLRLRLSASPSSTSGPPGHSTLAATSRRRGEGARALAANGRAEAGRMEDRQRQPGAKLARLREEVRRLACQDDRRSAAGCWLFALMLPAGFLALCGSFDYPEVACALLILFAALGLFAVSPVPGARRIAARIRHLSAEEKVAILAPLRESFAVREVLELLLWEMPARSEIAPVTSEGCGKEASAADRAA